MNNPKNKNLTWAQENGYEYNAESEGVSFEGAMFEESIETGLSKFSMFMLK
jgi:hypothetical protein